MGLKGSSSSGLAALFAVMIFAGLQIYKNSLSSTQPMTIIAGYIASWLFVFLVIAVNSLEQVLFGQGFETKLAEILICLFMSCLAAGMVHRVSSTVCFLSSIVAIYFINRISQSHHQSISASAKRK